MTVDDLYSVLEVLRENGFGDVRIGTTGAEGKFHEIKDHFYKMVNPITEDQDLSSAGEEVVVLY